MSPEQVERWERGERKPTPPELRALGDVYEVPDSEVERWIEVFAEPGETEAQAATHAAAMRRVRRSVPAPAPTHDPAPEVAAPPSVPVVPVVARPVARPAPEIVLTIAPHRPVDRRTTTVRSFLVAATLGFFGFVLWWAIDTLVATF